MAVRTKLSQGKILAWQVLFLALGTTWLLAPSLNHQLSYRVSLISQYETGSQPYSLFFRLGDLLAGILIVWVGLFCFKQQARKIPIILLLVTGIGMMLDPILTTTCQVHGRICQENFSFNFLLHAIETTVTASALFALSVCDVQYRKKLVSIAFVVFQLLYGALFLTQFANQQHFNTVSQLAYQCVTIVWLAWFCRDFLMPSHASTTGGRKTEIVRYSVAAWAFINGLLAILISLAHIHLFGRLKGLYFAGDNAWLAQHGVVVGVIMLYLSRHLLRGEARARQIFLLLAGVEVLKYSDITPNVRLLLFYSLTFCILFVTVNEFKRGTVPMTWQVRVKDLAYMLMALAIASLLVFVVLDRNSRVSKIAAGSFDHFTYYALHSDSVERHSHISSALLADTTTTFLVISVAVVLWILFRPYRASILEAQDYEKVRSVLSRHSSSSEDYFKIWPQDKQYFWSETSDGFIAYKVVGPVAFALADPITSDNRKAKLIEQFIDWSRHKRLRACFLPTPDSSLKYYKGLNNIQIGASALVGIEAFINKTSKDKWWRWKQNRAAKQGYDYSVSRPPHSTKFIKRLKSISDEWLTKGGHQERGFALGYFDEAYVQECVIHYLKNQTGDVVAFTNQLPTLNGLNTATIDLLRYKKEAGDTMPYLLLNTMNSVANEGYTYFDLGFVPFASTKGSIRAIARALSASRFSAKGLEQFKNKFDPDWHPNYLVYDGDLADLALITINLEKAMNLE